MRPSAPILGTHALSATPALASSEDAWAILRSEVEAACRAMLEVPGEIVGEVNPFGSQSYGEAFLTVISGGAATDRMICIHDKAAKVAELTTPF